MKRYFFSILIFFVMTIALKAEATTYYFSTSGSNESSGTLPTLPWKSLGKIFDLSSKNKIKPGDKFLLKRGDIWEKKDLQVGSFIRIENQSGRKNEPIVIGAYSTGENPILTGIGLGKEKKHTLLRLDNSKHIQIQDIHLIGGQFTQRFFLMTGEIAHIKVLRVNFDNTKENQYNPEDSNLSRYWGDGIYFREGSGYHHIEVSNCTFTGIGGFKSVHLNKADAINAAKPLGYFWIHHNKIRHCNEGIDIAGGKNHLIEKNLIEDVTEYQGIKIHSQYSHISNTVIRDNVVIGAKSWGIALENISNSMVYNNAIIGSGYGAALMGDLQDVGYKGTFKQNTIKNNIFYGLVSIYDSPSKENMSSINKFIENHYYNPKHKTLISRKFRSDITSENFKEEWQVTLEKK